MKILKIALILLIVIVPLAVIIIASQAESFLNKNKSTIEAQASKALGTAVKLGNIDLSVFPNAIVDLDSISIGKTESSPGQSVNGVKVNIALLKLLSKELLIEEITVNQPEILIEKTKDGIVIPGFTQKSKKTEEKTPVKKEKSKKAAIPNSLPITITLKKLDLKNAAINFKDKVSGKNIQIQPINFSTSLDTQGSILNLKDLLLVADIANITPVTLKSDLILLNLQESKASIPELFANALKTDVKVVGDLNIVTQQGEFKISAKQNDLSVLLKAAKEIIKAPALKTLQVGGEIKTDITAKLLESQAIKATGKIDLQNISAQQGIINLNSLAGIISLDASLNKTISASLKSDKLNFKLKDAPINLTFSANLVGDNFRLDNANINLFEGSANVNASHNLQTKALNSDLKVMNLDLSKAHQAVDIATLKTFEGTLNSFNLTSGGNLSSPPASLTANGNVMLTNGALKGTNLAASVLGVIRDLPFLTGSLLDVAPKELGALDANDTAIRELTAEFSLASSTLNLKNLKLLSSVFDLTASGEVGLDQSLNLKSEIIFNQAFSQALANKTKEIERILDSDGRLIIPLQIKGKVSKMIIVPNITRLLELAAKNAVKNKVKDKINEKLKDKTKGILQFGF